MLLRIANMYRSKIHGIITIVAHLQNVLTGYILGDLLRITNTEVSGAAEYSSGAHLQ
jgi:hypothetical protein